MKIIAKGAEADLYLDNSRLVKHRIRKSYRIRELDERLRKSRTRHEAKLLENARGLIPVPSVYEVDSKGNRIVMEFINGRTVKDAIDLENDGNAGGIGKKIGEYISRLHNMNLIHNDLTTSNMIIRDKKNFSPEKFPKEIFGPIEPNPKFRRNLGPIRASRISDYVADWAQKFAKQIFRVGSDSGGSIGRQNFCAQSEGKPSDSGNEIYFIDFGLGTTSTRIEDRAMDLVVLKKSLMAAHTRKFEIIWNGIIEGYGKNSKNFDEILSRIEVIEKRVRYA